MGPCTACRQRNHECSRCVSRPHPQDLLNTFLEQPPKPTSTKFRVKNPQTPGIVRYKPYFNILNRVGMAHGQRDERKYDGNSNGGVIRRALKVIKRYIQYYSCSHAPPTD